MSPADLLFEPFRPLFMQRAAIEVVLLAIPAGLLGTWVVTRRLAFVTHAVGHATFPALVIAVLAGWSLTGTSLVAAILLALVLGRLAERPGLAAGAAVAIVLSAALALGAVLVSDIADPGVRTNGLLFGSLLAIGWTDVTETAIVAGIVLGCSLALGRQLAAATFQRDLAVAEGQRAGAIDAVLMVLIAATIAVAVRAVGSLLVASLVLVPSATARLITHRIVSLHLVGVALAAGEGLVGLWIAYRLDAPPGAGIAVVGAAVFVMLATARAAWTMRRRQSAVVPT